MQNSKLNQAKDLQLLQSNPQQLLQKYAPLIVKVVHAHVQASAFSHLSKSDLLPVVRQQLYRQLVKLYKRHGKRSYIKTLILEATRMLCHHAEDLQLLEYQGGQLVVKYKPMIATQVYTYVNKDYLRDDQAEDVMQYVSERLLSKLQSDKIQHQSSGALFRTYFYQIIDNAIKDGIRRLKSQKATIGSGNELKAHHATDSGTFQSVSSKIDLEKQCSLYHQLLRQFKELEKCKFELSAKVSCYLVLQEGDVKWVLVSEEDKVELLVCFGKNYIHLSKEELWDSLVPFTNAMEQKSVSGNSLYKWFVRRRNVLLARILYVMNFDGQLQRKLSDLEKSLLTKLNQRAVGKFAEEYFGELAYAVYR